MALASASLDSCLPQTFLGRAHQQMVGGRSRSGRGAAHTLLICTADTRSLQCTVAKPTWQLWRAGKRRVAAVERRSDRIWQLGARLKKKKNGERLRFEGKRRHFQQERISYRRFIIP